MANDSTPSVAGLNQDSAEDQAPPASFALALPQGFIELPHGEPDEAQLRQVVAEISTLFGLDPDAEIDQGMAETALLLTATAAASAAAGSSYTAAGFFRSPDEMTRPVMVLVNCFSVASDHPSAQVAITGLLEVQKNTSNGPVEIVELPAGPAVVAQSSTSEQVTHGEDTIEVVQHAITAWIPAPTVVLGLAITSNNAQDWPRITNLAHGIFNSFQWETEDEVE